MNNTFPTEGNLSGLSRKDFQKDINDKKTDLNSGIMEIPGGRYAIFRHTGDYSSLYEFYRIIYEEWFPASRYRPQNTLSFEIYTNHSSATTKTELITDIYIPITKK